LQHSLDYKNSRISYQRFGSGKHTLLAFHGYGEEAGAFAFLEKYIGDQYTIYAIDLPYHGKTEWREGLNFSTSDLVDIVKKIITRANVMESGQTRNAKVSLAGFSLGGRMLLSLYETEPAMFDRLLLMAPDGLKVNFWYWLSTQTWPGNKFFAFTMRNPQWFFGFLKLLNKLKLVNASIFKFVNYYIGNKEVRQLLYDRWTTLRAVKPDLGKIKKLIAHHSTPVNLIYGKHDRIILSSVGEKFRRGIEVHCQLSVIESGHQVLHEKHVRDILQSLKGKS
jgi:pimeloyl-ACP methyl ester carboxylesterase